tara:strand:- start:3140 stop:4210 length:1071 start_codon:yes stop_codon:yes gene_type:complete
MSIFEKFFRQKKMMEFMNNNDGVLSTNQPNDGLLGNNNKGFFNNLSNINPNLIMGSQMIGAGLQGKDPFSSFTPALMNAAKLSKAFAKKGFRQLTNAEKEAKGLPQDKQFQLNLADGKISQIGGSGTNVTVNNPQETTEQKEIGKVFGEEFKEINTFGNSAQKSNQNLELLQTLNNMEDVKTGAFGELRLNASKLAKEFGLDVELTDITGSELISGVSGKIVLDGLANFKGAISDGERKFVKDITPGLSTSKEGNEKLLEIAVRQNELGIALQNEANNWVNNNGGLSKRDKESGLTWNDYKSKWHKANPIIDEKMKQSILEISQNPDTDFGSNIKTITRNGKQIKGVKIDGKWYQL